VISRDDLPPTPDWVPPFVRHCGELCFERDCPVCGVLVMPDCVLGEN
jgi:hypothetical protein